MTTLRALLLCVASFLGCCSRTAGDGPRANQPRTQVDARIRELADAAEIIVVADLEALGPSPGVWSGRYVAYQEARYHNIEYLKQRPGTTHGADTLVVLHPLVSGSPTADPDRPALRASLFHPAARLILFLRRQEESLITWDERDGATPATPKLVEALKQGFSESGP